MQVGNAVVEKESEAGEVDFYGIRSDDYTELSKVSGGRFLLARGALNKFYHAKLFTEIRFDCRKPYHGRRVNIKTVGDDVIQWLLWRRSFKPQPRACNTWSKLESDNSFIGGDCRRWANGVWRGRPMFYFPVYAHDDESGLGYWITLDYNAKKALFCDDSTQHSHFNNVGSWSFYIR